VEKVEGGSQDSPKTLELVAFEADSALKEVGNGTFSGAVLLKSVHFPLGDSSTAAACKT
jgi:hypothetical protein